MSSMYAMRKKNGTKYIIVVFGHMLFEVLEG